MKNSLYRMLSNEPPNENKCLVIISDEMYKGKRILLCKILKLPKKK